MTEARVVITAQDNASAVIDQVTRRLGLFNKEGLAMGVSFALINKAMELVSRGIQMFTDAIKDGINRSMQLELNITYLTNTIDDMNISVGALKDELNELSRTFGVDVNTLAVNMLMFTRQGYNATESLRLIAEATKFAIATNEDFASSVDTMNTVMEVFDMDAKDSGYIWYQLNALVDETNLSIQDIGNVMARASPNIREGGYSLEEIVNQLYTLSSEGMAPRTILAEINERMKDLEKRHIDILPDEEVASIDTKFAAVDKTAVKYFDKWMEDIKGRFGQVGDVIAMIAVDPWRKGTILNPDKPTPAAAPTPQADWMDEYIRKTAALDASIAALNITIGEETISLASLDQEYQRGLIQKDFIIATHDATLAVQQQEDAIEKLRRVANMYSLEQQINNLEIQKIQYSAMGTRRGLSRGQNKQIAAIEKENALLRIKEAEQQLQIGTIQQNGLLTAQDNLDKIRRQHDQTIYSQELADLKVHIRDVYDAWTAMYTQLGANKAKLLGQQGAYPAAPFVGPPAPSRKTGDASDWFAQQQERSRSQGLLDPLSISRSRVR